MPKSSQLQEVIIVSSTKFTAQQYVERGFNKSNTASSAETLKKACWNGMLKEMLPELFIPFSPDTQLFLWQMRECKNVFTLEMAENPTELDFEMSIDPYCFMELQNYN